mgnify:CR=1 FL=1
MHDDPRSRGAELLAAGHIGEALASLQRAVEHDPSDVAARANLAQALSVPETSLRLFGKPMATPRRRMGVVTATADDVESARHRATDAASLIRVVSVSAPTVDEEQTTADGSADAPSAVGAQDSADEARTVNLRPAAS